MGLVAYFIVSTVIYLATGFQLGSILLSDREHSQISSDATNVELTALAFNVLEYISDGEFESLAEVVHPDFGVVFSPGATINLATNRHFNAEQIALFGSDSTVYVWGIRNGTGEPIELTPMEYLDQFVLSSDYLNASIIGVDRIIRSGNALENIIEEFPGVRFVDFHIPGEERNGYDDLDWSTLRLGFERHDDKLWLTVIVHSTWTV